TPMTPITRVPPFQLSSAALPNFFRGRIRSHDLVAVGVDERGDVVSVTANQRLLVVRTTDFRLTVPAPATDVVAAPGSDSRRGPRRVVIMGQRFSVGRKGPAAGATLAPKAASPALPLSVASGVQPSRRETATPTPAESFSAVGNPAQIAQLLDA